MQNLLENWKRECYLLSSPLSIKKTLNRKDVDGVCQTLIEYFGLDYFNITQEQTSPNSEPNWLHFLLVNHKRQACILALFEVAHLINYLQKQNETIQNKLKSLHNHHRQFRDVFFEVYIARILDFNTIPNVKSPMEGDKELDIVCTVDGQEYLCECLKIYIPNFYLLEDLQYILAQLFLKIETLNKRFGLIGTIKFNKPNSQHLKSVLEAKIARFISGCNEQNFGTIDYHDIDGDGELHIIDYDLASSIEIENDVSKYNIFFKITPPPNPLPNVKVRYDVSLKANFGVPQFAINNKVLSALIRKHEQHSKSVYEKKIYFIDSESIPDFAIPIFRMENMFDRVKIQEYVDTFSENEIFCFIRRDYMDKLPIISIEAFGKNINPAIKRRLESLKTNFAYSLS